MRTEADLAESFEELKELFASSSTYEEFKRRVQSGWDGTSKRVFLSVEYDDDILILGGFSFGGTLTLYSALKEAIARHARHLAMLEDVAGEA